MLNGKLSFTIVSHLRPLSTGSKGQDMEEDSRIPLKITERVRALHNTKLSTKQKISSIKHTLYFDYPSLERIRFPRLKILQDPVNFKGLSNINLSIL